jgi:hypothetical protein
MGKAGSFGMQNSGKGPAYSESSLRSYLGEGRAGCQLGRSDRCLLPRATGRFDHRPLGVARPEIVDQLVRWSSSCTAGRVATCRSAATPA